MKKKYCLLLLLLIMALFIPKEVNAKIKCKTESNNSSGIVVHITNSSYVQGTVQVHFYKNNKIVGTKTKVFTCTKNYLINFNPPAGWESYDSDCTYKVSLKNIKKAVKITAATKVKISIKRKKNKKLDVLDDIAATIKNTSKKTIKYNAILVLRYKGKDVFGENCKGQFYESKHISGTLKPGKKKTFKCNVWSDYKLSSKVYLDAYYK